MKILACNVGSTSLKFKLYLMPELKILSEGRIERVGSANNATYRYGNQGRQINYKKEKQSIPDYTTGIRMFLDSLVSKEEGALESISEIEAVCFKTVLSKGFYGVHLLTDEVMKGMQDYMGIAGSHNGPYINAIRQFEKILPQAKMVGVFETSFHRTIPLERTLYGIPYEWYEKYGIRKMGYHGASHGFMAERIGKLYGSKHKLISCHLGGSSSICAILNGKSVNNSFGISLQTGVMHATRTGDADPFLVPFLLSEGMAIDEIKLGLTKKGGLLGISGVSEDLRDIEQAADEGNQRAKLAIDVYCSHIIHYIGAFYADLGGLDFLTFTGGIGENSHVVRQKVCNALGHMGITLDNEKNKITGAERVISADGSAVKVCVIPTNEEQNITQQTYNYLTTGSV